MVNVRQRSILVSFAVALMAFAVAASANAADGYRGPTRVNFDDRLIKGQTAKAGSVYIFERQQIAIPSLVNRKRVFRPLIIKTVFEPRP